MSNETEAIKERLDLADFIGEYVRLEKAGRNFKARCPFHNEKTPSFVVSPEKQVWHCFGCGKGGDLFTFTQEMDGLEFYDALKILADRTGIRLEKRFVPEQNKKARLYEIMELAVGFFENQLKVSKISAPLFDYFEKRGINKDSVKKFRLGYAPSGWNFLLNFLKAKGFNDGEIKAAGLAVSGRNNSLYDIFRHRLIFPIFDLQGQVVAFGGRILDFLQTEQEAAEAKTNYSPKYINSPETLFYNKSKTLYGLDKAKTAIKAKGEVIIVEGYMDVILSHQAGVENVVASSGTALTKDHLGILKRYTDKAVLSFDRDEAGVLAQERSIVLAQKAGLEVKLLLFEGGKDPADIVKESEEKWRDTAQKSQGIMDFVLLEASRRFGVDTAENKRRFAAYVLPFVKRIQNPIERAHWIVVVAEKLEIPEESVNEALGEQGNENEYQEPAIVFAKPNKSRIDILEERLFGFFLLEPESIILEPEFFSHKRISYGVGLVKRGLLKELETGYYQRFRFVAEEEKLAGLDIKQEAVLIKNEIEKLLIKSDIKKAAEDIKKAEARNDVEQLKILSVIIKDLMSNLKKY